MTERGHLLRDAARQVGPARPRVAARRVGALVVGAGIAGLGAARALLRAGVDDCHVLELEDSAGGNSRGHAIAGMRLPARRALPAGAGRRRDRGDRAARRARPAPHRGRPAGLRRAHAVPQPAGAAVHRRRLARRPAAADRGVAAAERAATLAQYRRFAAAVDRRARRRGAFSDPDRALALERCARRARRGHLRGLARCARPDRAGAALVPRLLLPRRLRRRRARRSRPGPACTTSRAGTAFARRATRPWRRERRRRADLARRQCLAQPSGSPRRSASGCMPAWSRCAWSRIAQM